MASGPSRSRHRFGEYRPTSLCLWYGRDRDSLRWTSRDGLAGIIDLARIHLAREVHWRATGVWLGPEVHLEPRVQRHRPKRQNELDRERMKRARLRCWCASGRAYTACHGALSAAEELSLLGVANPPPRELSVAV